MRDKSAQLVVFGICIIDNCFCFDIFGFTISKNDIYFAAIMGLNVYFLIL